MIFEVKYGISYYTSYFTIEIVPCDCIYMTSVENIINYDRGGGAGVEGRVGGYILVAPYSALDSQFSLQKYAWLLIQLRFIIQLLIRSS